MGILRTMSVRLAEKKFGIKFPKRFGIKFKSLGGGRIQIIFWKKKKGEK